MPGDGCRRAESKFKESRKLWLRTVLDCLHFVHRQAPYPYSACQFDSLLINKPCTERPSVMDWSWPNSRAPWPSSNLKRTTYDTYDLRPQHRSLTVHDGWTFGDAHKRMGVPDNQDYDMLLENVKWKFCQAPPGLPSTAGSSTRLTYSCHSTLCTSSPTTVTWWVRKWTPTRAWLIGRGWLLGGVNGGCLPDHTKSGPQWCLFQ